MGTVLVYLLRCLISIFNLTVISLTSQESHYLTNKVFLKIVLHGSGLNGFSPKFRLCNKDFKSVKLNLYTVFFKEVDNFLSSVLVQTTV